MFSGSIFAARQEMNGNLITEMAIMSMLCSICDTEKGQTDGMLFTVLRQCIIFRIS